MMKLVIGDKNLSSWSLRPWLAARQAGFSFVEVPVSLRGAKTRAEIFKHSPSGKVPCLIDGDTVVWDSLAICEYLAEQAPTLWPADRSVRAEARAVSAEMHSGFSGMRQSMSMDIRAAKPGAGRTPEALDDIARIATIWEGCRRRFVADGPFLFGNFSIADAMFAPVVWRFSTYAVELPALAQDWMGSMLALPAMREWQAGALSEPA